MQAAVFLDLDKTIIEDLSDLSATDQVTLIKGAAPAIASMRSLGYKIIVAANYEQVARGRCTMEDVDALHERVTQLLRALASGAAIDAFYACPYHPRGIVEAFKQDHPNRKPKPGMLLQAADDMDLDLSQSWMIGDELTDTQAGQRAGVRTILLRPDAEQLNQCDSDHGLDDINDEQQAQRTTSPNFFAVSLVDAARLIAQQPKATPIEAVPHKPNPKWDNAKIAKLQVPRPASAPKPTPAAQADKKDEDTPKTPRAFRPWDAPPAPDTPDPSATEKSFRRRPKQEPAEAAPTDPRTPQSAAAPADAEPAKDTPPAVQEAAAQEPTAQPAHPRQRKDASSSKANRDKPRTKEDEQLKLQRLILCELRSQRNTTQEFTFLTIVAVALQLLAIVCLLGGLFMGGVDDAMFIRWLGAAIVAQLMSIATLMYGR